MITVSTEQIEIFKKIAFVIYQGYKYKVKNNKVYYMFGNKLEEVEDYDNHYLILTDEEADELAKENILESLFAFNPEFIVQACGLPDFLSEYIKEHIIRHGERANEDICDLIKSTCGINDFIDQVMANEGRAVFINADADETEIIVENIPFYIYPKR